MTNKVYELNQTELMAVSGGVIMPVELGIVMDIASGIVVVGFVGAMASKRFTPLLGFLGGIAGFYGVGALSRYLATVEIKFWSDSEKVDPTQD